MAKRSIAEKAGKSPLRLQLERMKIGSIFFTGGVFLSANKAVVF
jgi:hypothetical protein